MEPWGFLSALGHGAQWGMERKDKGDVDWPGTQWTVARHPLKLVQNRHPTKTGTQIYRVIGTMEFLGASERGAQCGMERYELHVSR